MSLKFYAGPAGSGKTTALLKEMIDRSLKEPERKFFVIVPEQFTNDTQRLCLRLHPRRGLMNIDVLSVSRLAYRVQSELGGTGEEMLEEIGKSFIVEKIALDLGKKLPFFGEGLARPGNAAEMKSLISECMLYDVKPEDLTRGAEGSMLSAKMKDIGTFYEAFLGWLRDHKAMTAEELPDYLARLLPRSELLRDATVILDGFTGFTPVQMRLVGEILSAARDVTVALTLEKGRDPLGRYKKTDLFAMSYETAEALAEMAQERGVRILPTVYAADGQDRFTEAADLRHLEQNLFRRERRVYAEKPSRIDIFAAGGPMAEVQETARRIKRLIREENYRYRDFAVITGDLPTYGNYIREIFPRYGIPCFVDEKRLLTRTAFVEYLRAALECCAADYAPDAVFRMLRTGMTDFTDAEIDRLENHVTALGIRSKRKWREKWIYHGKNEDPETVPALNKLRERFLYYIDPLAEALADRKGTVLTKTGALYEFCLRSGCEQKLAGQAEAFGEAGRQDLMRETKSVYGIVMGLLDKLAAVLGDEKISMRGYRALLEAGFAEQKLGIIPPGADQVMAGDMERSRPANVKVLFFIGVNEGIVPKTENGGGLLTESDRDHLAARHVKLKPTARENLVISRYYMYLTLSKPSDRLYLMYSEADIDGAVRRPSYLISSVRRLYTDLPVRTGADPMTAEGLYELPESPADGFSLLAGTIGTIADKPPVPAFFEFFKWYRNDPAWFYRTEALLDALNYRRPKDVISRRTARMLYGDRLVNSATRLERFSECAFAHFVSYGLRLKEREEYSFSGMDMGNVLHSALETFAGELAKEGRSWADLSSAERNARAEAAVRSAALTYGADILTDTSRSEYQVRRMERLMKTSVWALAEQLARGDFQPTGFEMAFSGQDGLDSLTFDLGDGAQMTLTGRIDRVDTFREDNTLFVKIIDYKTGAKKFDMTAVYHGLQLQLVLYLKAAMEVFRKQGYRTEPAGVFYYEIKDPIEKSDGSLGGEELLKNLLTDMKASGYVSSEPAVLSHLDRTLGPGNQKSDVMPVELKKGGEFSAKSNVLDSDQFDVLLSFVSRKVRRIAERIMSGDAQVNPYTYKSRWACDYCAARGICGFDRRLPGNDFRRLKTMEDEEALSAMEEEK